MGVVGWMGAGGGGGGGGGVMRAPMRLPGL